MTNLKYKLATNKIVNTLAEAKASNKPYEVIFEDVVTETKKMSPMRLFLLKNFGCVSKKIFRKGLTAFTKIDIISM